MDPLVYLVCSILVGVLLVLLFLLKRSASDSTPDFTPGEEASGVRAPTAVRRREDAPAGARRRAPRQRLAQRQDRDSEESEEDVFGDIALPEGKVGAKKLRKLQEKAEKKAQREAEVADREDRKKREAKLEEQRKKEEAKQQQLDAAREEEEKLLREEKERQEHEEYLKMKEAFSVDDEGTHEAELNQDSESLLTEFINYIKNMKVVMLEDLAAHFKLKTQEAIDRVNELQGSGQLTGVIDDRGKFIYITMDELESVAKFIKQRGRVSIVELAESSNRLINLNPDMDVMQQKLQPQTEVVS